MYNYSTNSMTFSSFSLSDATSPFDPTRPSTESELGCDAVFLVGSEPDVQRIPAASRILAAGSPVFRAMFAPHKVAPGGATPQAAASRLAEVEAVAPPPGSPLVSKAPIAVSDVDGRAFDILLR